MNPVRFAILGAGVVAEYHRQAIATTSHAHLAVVAHYDPSRFPAIAQQFGVPCQSYQAVLEDPAIDAVCICTPSGQHAAQAIAAAHAGKHVLVEKPMAVTVEEADQMIAACQEAGVRLGVLYQRRAEPLFQRIHAALAAGELGQLTLGLVSLPYRRDAAYYAQAKWRGTWSLDGGGVLMNQGIHLIDLLVWYMGDPQSVHASYATLRHTIEVEDTLVATLQFEQGALATITATTTTDPGYPHRLELYGTDGAIQIEGETITRWHTRQQQETNTTLQPSGAGGDPKGIAPTSHALFLDNFVAAIRHGSTLFVDGAEGRRSLAAVCALYTAGR